MARDTSQRVIQNSTEELAVLTAIDQYLETMPAGYQVSDRAYSLAHLLATETGIEVSATSVGRTLRLLNRHQLAQSFIMRKTDQVLIPKLRQRLEKRIAACGGGFLDEGGYRNPVQHQLEDGPSRNSELAPLVIPLDDDPDDDVVLPAVASRRPLRRNRSEPQRPQYSHTRGSS